MEKSNNTNLQILLKYYHNILLNNGYDPESSNWKKSHEYIKEAYDEVINDRDLIENQMKVCDSYPTKYTQNSYQNRRSRCEEQSDGVVHSSPYQNDSQQNDSQQNNETKNIQQDNNFIKSYTINYKTINSNDSNQCEDRGEILNGIANNLQNDDIINIIQGKMSKFNINAKIFECGDMIKLIIKNKGGTKDEQNVTPYFTDNNKILYNGAEYLVFKLLPKKSSSRISHNTIHNIYIKITNKNKLFKFNKNICVFGRSNKRHNNGLSVINCDYNNLIEIKNQTQNKLICINDIDTNSNKKIIDIKTEKNNIRDTNIISENNFISNEPENDLLIGNNIYDKTIFINIQNIDDDQINNNIISINNNLKIKIKLFDLKSGQIIRWGDKIGNNTPIQAIIETLENCDIRIGCIAYDKFDNKISTNNFVQNLKSCTISQLCFFTVMMKYEIIKLNIRLTRLPYTIESKIYCIQLYIHIN